LQQIEKQQPILMWFTNNWAAKMIVRNILSRRLAYWLSTTCSNEAKCGEALKIEPSLDYDKLDQNYEPSTEAEEVEWGS
jgi:hypothetical protein